MPHEPQIAPLAHRHRRRFFLTLVGLFLLIVPVFVFYTTGYRVQFDGDRSIQSVGGFYLDAEAEDRQIYLDGALVDDARMFRRAAYIPNVKEGMHELYVERDGLQTWVKELPVYPHIVTEARAFNMPRTPHVRYIPEYLAEDGVSLFRTQNASSTPSRVATTTNAVRATSSLPATAVPNPEYEYVDALFASSTEASLFAAAVERARDQFRFSEATVDDATTTATTTQTFRDATLYTDGTDVFVTHVGSDVPPYYFCVRYFGTASTTDAYGAHVTEQLREQVVLEDVAIGSWTCRDTIKINRKRMEVRWFSFYPDTDDRVLLLLNDGLYVVEVDDRAWQNVQLLYPGTDIAARVDGSDIYIRDDERYFKVITEIAPTQ